MKNIVFLKLSILFCALSFSHSHANEKSKTLKILDNETTKDTLKPNQKKDSKASLTIDPPRLDATGNQLYCPQTNIKIVETFTITADPSQSGTSAMYIQISSGYSAGFDKLELSNSTAYPNIVSSWDSNAGRLTLSSLVSGQNILYADFEKAVRDVVFSNSSLSASGSRTFSITIDQLNYLPSTGHYYYYEPFVGITWSQAKSVAEGSTYFGLKGYLATILSADEAKLIGEQTSGTGWIGGSDAETEGVWKWVTGPEAGTVMTYTFWNTGEPNQRGDEDYAHITQPGVGIKGSWNDLSNTGDPSGSYQPKGYVIEYGGSPGDPILHIATSTKITIPEVTVITPQPICDSGRITIAATATAGATISWYDQAMGGNLLGTGNSFLTDIISTTTTYYAQAANCDSSRKSVVAVVNKTPAKPIVTSSDVPRCGPGSVNLEATSDVGAVINWYKTVAGGTSVYTGSNFPTPPISTNTTYYAEASNNGCTNVNRTPANVIIYTPPVVTDETVPLCQNETITLDAGISGMSYKWSTGATTQIIDDVTTGGIYTVIVTSPAPESCPSTKTITVNENLVPQIDHIDVNSSTATIKLVKEQDYFEYSIDGGEFQNSNVFNNVSGGLHTASVRDKTGCPGVDQQTFIVLDFPAFFTPNNDTYNDVWEVKGMENYPEAQITIFDRYGKLLAQLTPSRMSWDGTFNKSPLPASDYWYALKIDNTKPVMRGHFSLKR